MAQTIDELTINYEEEGLLKVKELKKEILSKGSWTTIMFLYQDWNASKNEYGPVKISIRRYRKLKEYYSQQSKFNFSSKDQALKIADKIYEWFPKEGS